METYPQPSNILERFNRWIEESITVKLVSIGFLVLILLIPSAWIQSLMEERELRAGEVINEVSSKWSGPQTLSGPILVIPYKREVSRTDHAKGTVEITETIENYYFLPEKLDIKGDIQPEELHRGIFDVAVYSSALALNSTFVKPDFKSLGISEDKVLWKDAHMIFSISDLRGISDNPVFKIGGVDKSTEPSNQLGITFNGLAGDYAQPGVENSLNNTSSGIIARLGWLTSDDFKESTAVSINLKGSQQLSFVPTGKTTTVKLEGKWGNPSFDGEFLPVDRSVSESAFSANWKILHYNRPFAQQWTRSTASFSGYEFGVKLLVPVDQYQKSIRTSKYGQLIIILTFVALFLVEITKKIRIHPFQYILIGVALIIYYTLLLSLSEQVGYNIAYWISAASTVGLISFYSTSFLKSTNLVVLFTSLLAIFYTFIFIIILQQDFSLLLGSIGLFMIVGALMYFSRKVEWYK
ncbi:MAG: cell envelope integrity protein CreD [Cyclobacteriaceae bacterium]|nr:cell envelope integrity protein CreD [Cyclobacteriaceae bacterium]